MQKPVWDPPLPQPLPRRQEAFFSVSHFGLQFKKLRPDMHGLSSLWSSSHITMGTPRSEDWLSISQQWHVQGMGHSTWESFICILAKTWRKPTTASHSLLWARLCWLPMQGPCGEEDILMSLKHHELLWNLSSKGIWHLLIWADRLSKSQIFHSSVFSRDYYFFLFLIIGYHI